MEKKKNNNADLCRFKWDCVWSGSKILEKHEQKRGGEIRVLDFLCAWPLEKQTPFEEFDAKEIIRENSHVE